MSVTAIDKLKKAVPSSSEAEIDDLYDNQGDQLKKTPGRTQQIINAFSGGGDDNVTMRIDSNFVVREIPITKIKARSVNDYIVSDIESLAEDIEELGQFDPILVKKNEDEDKDIYEFIVISGHRRLEACKYLRKKHFTKLSEKDFMRFNYIKAKILTKEEAKNEEAIYEVANNSARRISTFEMLMVCKSQSININDEAQVEKMIKYLHGENGYIDYVNGNIKIKINDGLKYDYLKKLIGKKFRANDIAKTSIRIYTQMIEKANKELIGEIYSNHIPLREALVIANYSSGKQNYLVGIYGTKEYEDFMSERKTRKENGQQEEGEREAEISTRTEDGYGKIIRIKSSISKLCKEFEVVRSNTKENKLNGNQKELIREFKKIAKAVEKLSKMATK